MSKYAIDPCKIGDLPELFARFAEWYRFNPRLQERDYFDWQFAHAPTRLANGDYDFLLLRDAAGAIVGCLGFVGFEFMFTDRTAIGGWTHNWYAANQGEGGLALLTRFMELVDNRFLLRLNEHSKGVTDLLRIPSLAVVPRWWLPLDVDAIAQVLGVNALADRDTMTAAASRSERIEGKSVIGHVSRLGPDDEFLPTHFPDVAGYARRTGQYLNWRYVDIPRHNYRILRTEREFGVYRIETVMGHDVSVVRILEWTFGPETTAAALASVLAAAADRRPILVDFHCTAVAIGQMLEQFGFIRQEATIAPMPDLFRPTFYSGGYAVAIDLPPHRSRRSIDFDRWYITIGDSDIDRVKL